MPDINSNDRQAELTRIAARRKAMLDAEESMRQKRLAEKKEFEMRGQSAFQEEIKAAAGRSVEREEWRQDQHVKSREEQTEKIRLEEQKKEELLKEEKKKEFDAEQKKDIVLIHEIAITKRLAAREKSIQKEEHESEKKTEELTGRERREIDTDLDRTLLAIAREVRKKEDTMKADLLRRKNILETSFAHAKQHLLHEESQAREPKQKAAIGHEQMQLVGEHKRQILRLEKEEESMSLKLRQEREALEREAKAHAMQKRSRNDAEHDRRIREAHQRQETALEWIGLNDPEA